MTRRPEIPKAGVIKQAPLVVAQCEGGTMWCRFCHTAIMRGEQFYRVHSSSKWHKRCVDIMSLGSQDREAGEQVLQEVLCGKQYE